MIKYSDDHKCLLWQVGGEIYAVPGAEPIKESGERAFINEENYFTVRSIMRWAENNPTFLNNIMQLVGLESKMEAAMLFIGAIAHFYATEECPYEELRNVMAKVMIENFTASEKLL